MFTGTTMEPCRSWYWESACQFLASGIVLKYFSWRFPYLSTNLAMYQPSLRWKIPLPHSLPFILLSNELTPFSNWEKSQCNYYSIPHWLPFFNRNRWISIIVSLFSKFRKIKLYWDILRISCAWSSFWCRRTKRRDSLVTQMVFDSVYSDSGKFVCHPWWTAWSCDKLEQCFWLQTYESLLLNYLEVWHILAFAMSGSLQCRSICSFCDELLWL